MNYRNLNGFVVLYDLDLPVGGGIKIDFYEGGRREPACVFPNLTEESLFEPNDDQTWNWATEYRGMVPGDLIRDNCVYWNYFVNFYGVPEERQQKLHIVRYAAGGRVLSECDMTVCIDDPETVFLNNWQEWEGAPVGVYENMEPNRQSDPSDAVPGWTVANCSFGKPRLTLFGTDSVPALSYCPGLSGKYEVIVCIKEEVLECKLELPGQKSEEWVFINSRTIPFNKFWKEIYIGTYDFKETDRIGIHQANATRYNPLRRFGDIYYFKLIPVKTERKSAFRSRLSSDQELLFYSEPYSLAYYHNLQTEEMAQNLVDIYADLGVDKIVCQMGRTGSFMLYPSKTAKAGRSGRVKGDDQQTSNGVSEMMASLDILEVLARLCRRKGIRFISNVGVNSSYRGSPLETRFSMDHPEYYHHHLLDFSIPEVLDFATEVFREMSEYEIDGLNVSHTRYPYYQTKETIVAFHRMIVEKIGAGRRSELELGMSFVADDPEYYQAIEILLKENLIDHLIPGRLMCINPPVNLKPYIELASRYGKKVYGLIDGWNYSYSGMNSHVLPRTFECDALIQNYLSQGADGIYFYQSEQILSHPFLKRLVKGLKK